MDFVKAWKIDVSEHVESKGKYNYLSWPYALKALKELDENALWKYILFNHYVSATNVIQLPFMRDPSTHNCYVMTEVTVNNVTIPEVYPVTDYQNKPIENPNCYDINTSLKRCLVKNIASFGPGLYLYAGEDLPDYELSEQVKKKLLEKAKNTKQEKLIQLHLSQNKINKSNIEKYETVLNMELKKTEDNSNEGN